MTSFGKLCYVLGIVVAIGVGMGLNTPYEQGKSVDGSVGSDTPGLYTKYNDCAAKPGKQCTRNRQRCKASEPGNNAYLCKPGEGTAACGGTDCVRTNNDALAED
ncbi:hypothetical protein FACS189443_6910 [Planctomycetales bacterium]|nr:hypothetical protein FACS189443_6910 [Planctomycetales bacterium]